MSQNVTDTSTAFPNLLPSFPSHLAVQHALRKDSPVWEHFLLLPEAIRQELLDFCIGKHGLRITYDPVFQRIFHPWTQTKRLESLLSSILGRTVSILEIFPREGTRLAETGSFVIMDILVRLDDGSYANVEMQKIGYSFPLARADCYASDIIMRQYEKRKSELGPGFSFSSLHKVYCIILMEESPAAFYSQTNQYIHKRTASFDTGICTDNAGLHEDIFICLDIFRSVVHTITKRSTPKEAWLTFLSATDIDSITALVSAFPMFLPIYQEITDFAKNPKELMNMFSEALRIMDRNLERQMVEEMRAEAAAKIAAANARLQAIENEYEAVKDKVKAAKDEARTAKDEARTAKDEARTAKDEARTAKDEARTAKDEAEIFRLRLLCKSDEEIAQTLSLPLVSVQKVLSSLNE